MSVGREGSSFPAIFLSRLRLKVGQELSAFYAAGARHLARDLFDFRESSPQDDYLHTERMI